jgi:hypothetical protein
VRVPKANRIGDAGRLVVDLIMKRDRVSLYLLPEQDRVRDSNWLIELPVDPALGDEDPNYCLLWEMWSAGDAEIARQRGG